MPPWASPVSERVATVAAMTDAALLAGTISALSLVIAASSLAWSMSSWRRSGPQLRVHALLYDEVLTVRIFNAGRSPDRIEQAVLGGTRHGHGGVDITSAVGGATLLRPGESLHQELRWQELVPARRHRALRAGWESLWLLRGSMQEQRVEVLPLRAHRPPECGWDLAAVRSHQHRVVPLLMAVPLLWIGADAVTHSGQAWIFFLILGAVLAYRLFAGLLRLKEPILRRRAENWTVGVGGLAVAALWATRTDATYVLAAYVAVAALLAWPGAISRLVLETPEALAALRARVPRRGRSAR